MDKVNQSTHDESPLAIKTNNLGIDKENIVGKENVELKIENMENVFLTPQNQIYNETATKEANNVSM